MSFRGVRRAIADVDRLTQSLILARGSLNAIRPSDIPRGVRPSDVFQNPNLAPPEGFQRSATGGLIPTASGTSQVPATALPGSPGIYIPPDYSEAARERREGRSGGWNEQEAARFVAALEALNRRLQEVAGEQNIFSPLIQQQLRNIEARVLSPEESETALRGIMQSFFAGFQQEAATGTREMRALANQILQFLGGAGIPGGGAFPTLDLAGTELTAGPRPAPVPGQATSGRSTTGGIGGIVGSAVREAVSGLGATVASSVREEGASTRAAIGGQINRVESTVRETATEQRDANRRLAEQFRDVGRTTVRTEESVRALGRQTMSAEDLRRELERLRLSGTRVA